MPSRSQSADDAVRPGVGRRRLLQAGALTLGGAALAPLVSANGSAAGAEGLSSASALAKEQVPDKLFQQGWFQKADRGYRRLLRKDPNNAHALGRRGYIALLSNKFEVAQTFLTRAIELKSDDAFSTRHLADTYVRQDRLAEAVPLLQRLGETERAWAITYDSISGTPYDVHGPDSTTVPFPALDPLPHFEVSINGREPQLFVFDTGATLNLTKETAQAAGLVGLATSHIVAAGQRLTVTHGVADSIRIGGIELRNVPVTWPDQIAFPQLPGGALPAGVVGTEIFYRFLTTLDYTGHRLVLRRKTTTQLQRFRAEASTAGAEILPLWLATDHFPCTLGSLNHYGPRVVLLDSGAFGMGFISIERFARASRIELGYPDDFGLYQVVAEEISLGDAIGRDMPGLVRPDSCPDGPCPLPPDLLPFEVIAAFAHEFYRPLAVTFDFVDMNLYITGDLK